jgi:hypothetical protein
MGELYAKSVHAKAFQSMGAPGCATCHDNHAIKPAGVEMVGLTEGAACASCHTSDDAGGKAATGMRAALEALTREHARAAATLERAEHAGMEVSQARVAVHAANPQAVTQEADIGLAIAAKAYARGLRALEDLKFRRQGLAVSLVIILGLIIGLILKIRELDRRHRFAARHSITSSEEA